MAALCLLLYGSSTAEPSLVRNLAFQGPLCMARMVCLSLLGRTNL